MALIAARSFAPRPAFCENQQNVQRLEKGGGIPSTNTLLRIARATGHKLVISFHKA